jgi:hypothetical protein
MTKLVVLLVLGFSSLAPAATLDIRSANTKNMVVDKDRGGGNAVNGQLFDFYENEGTEEINVTKLPLYKDFIAPLLKRLEDRLPKVTAYLTESLQSKHWYLEPKEISSEDCVNSSMIKADKKILACQSPFEVRIDSLWFSEMTEKNPQQAAALIVHELLVSKMLEDSQAISEESVRYLNRVFFSGSLPSAKELRDTLAARGFAYFATAQETAALNADLKKAALVSKRDIEAACPTPSSVVKIEKLYELGTKTSINAMDGRYSTPQQGQFLKVSDTLLRILNKSLGNESTSCTRLRAFSDTL